MLHVCLPFLNISSLVILVKVPSRILLTEHCESKQFLFCIFPIRTQNCCSDCTGVDHILLQK